MLMPTVNVYESEILKGITGPAIRPGGFDLTEKGVSLCHLTRGARILDVGCGSGATVEYLNTRHGLNAAGLDLSDLLLREGRKRARRLQLFRATAACIPLRDASLSAAFCECVLSLTPDPQSVLKEIFRVLEPGGFLIATDIYLRHPDACRAFGGISFNCCLKGAAGRYRILEMVSNAGFTLRAWEDHTHLLKVLAVQIVMACGSMRRFWSFFCGGCESDGIAARAAGFRPGYYFLAAKKESNGG